MAISLTIGHKSSPATLDDLDVKIVVIGERSCGKTRLISSFHCHHFFGEAYSHNGVTIYPCELRANEPPFKLSIFEIPGDYDLPPEERIPHYFDADVIVFVYAVDDPVSLHMLTEKWLLEAELAIDVHERPVVFIGAKSDLRDDQRVIDRLALLKQTPVTLQQASVLLNQVSTGFAIFQCSAIYFQHIHRVFYTILQLVDVEPPSGV